MKLITRNRLILLCGAATLLSGCATRPSTLYGWGSYQSQVYDHLKGEGKGPEAQIEALEKHLQEMRSKGQTPAPGYHAHLGLLYTKAGRADQAPVEFATEKSLFPEGAQFMDFLLNKFKKAGS